MIGYVLHPAQAETGTANGASVDLTQARSGAEVYFQSFAPGYASATAKVQHSLDDSTYVDLAAFFVSLIGRSSQKATVPGLVNRYVRASWVGATGSPPWSLMFSQGTTPIAPSDLSGLILWLEAGSCDGSTDEGAGVGVWPDKSGSSYHATQSLLSNQPTLRRNVLNGYSVLRFNGTSSYMNTALSSTAQPYTAFVVGKQTSKATHGRFLDNTNVGARALMGLDTSGFVVMAALTVVTGAVDRSGNFGVMTGVFNGAASFCYWNGTADLSSVNPSTNAWANMRLGADSSLTAFLNGDLAEVLFYSRALTTPERQQIERYFGRKYGITVA